MQIIQRMLTVKSELLPGQQIILFAERTDFLKRRWRSRAENGREFGFDLEERLTEGCVIFHENGWDYLVRQLPETVYEIALTSAEQAALVGWKTGNLHMPTEVLAGSIRVLHDEAMRQLLEREGWSYTEPRVIFRPLKAMAHG